jgi:putative DNA-invertase from lambdoid prophage Rac
MAKNSNFWPSAKSPFFEIEKVPILGRVFGQGENVMRVGLYARVSTHDQQTLPLQMQAMQAYVKTRDWQITMQVQDISSGAVARPQREAMLKAARRRELDIILVWRLDRWGRSMADLIMSLQELSALGVGFVSLTEALDLTTPMGRAMVGMLAVFAEFERDVLKERVKAGIAQARKDGKPHGRPPTVAHQQGRIQELYAKGVSKSQIARELGIARTSVRRLLGSER